MARFNEIWESNNAQEWRQRVTSHCHKCDDFEYCLGGCKTQPKLSNNTQNLIGSMSISRQSPNTEKDIRLFCHLKTYSKYDIADGQQGLFLFQGKHVRYFSESHRALLSYVSLSPTLEDIRDRFGPSALATVYDLYEDNMLSLC